MTDPSFLEKLVILNEECAEVQHAISKIIRHGRNNYHPDAPHVSNIETLEKEIGHLLFAIDFITNDIDIIERRVSYYKKEKAQTIKRWLQHNDVVLHDVPSFASFDVKLERVYNTCISGSIEDSVKMLIEIADGYADVPDKLERYVDHIIVKKVKFWPTILLVGCLTSLFPYKDKIRNYTILFDTISLIASSTHDGDTEISKLLDGLI